MNSCVLLFLLTASTLLGGELPYKLPPHAKYTASEETIVKAKAALNTNLVDEVNTLTNLFVSPMICGPGLWSILNDSAYFSKPPIAKGTVQIPLGKGKVQKLSMTLFQNDAEVASFRKALVVLIQSQGKLTIRDPNKDEFMMYWAVTPFDVIDGPLLVADGKKFTFIFEFEKGKIFWADEVKNMHFKKTE